MGNLLVECAVTAALIAVVTAVVLRAIGIQTAVDSRKRREEDGFCPCYCKKKVLFFLAGKLACDGPVD